MANDNLRLMQRCVKGILKTCRCVLLIGIVYVNFDLKVGYPYYVAVLNLDLVYGLFVEICFVCRVEIFGYPFAVGGCIKNGMLTRNSPVGQKNLAAELDA